MNGYEWVLGSELSKYIDESELGETQKAAALKYLTHIKAIAPRDVILVPDYADEYAATVLVKLTPRIDETVASIDLYSAEMKLYGVHAADAKTLVLIRYEVEDWLNELLESF